MALCDQLEMHLTDSQNESRRLLEAILYRAFDPSGQRQIVSEKAVDGVLHVS